MVFAVSVVVAFVAFLYWESAWEESDPELAKYDEHYAPPSPFAPVPAALLACAPANDAETLPAHDAATQPASRKKAA